MPPSDSIKWGLIGASDIASTALIPAIRACGAEVSSVLSGDAARGAHFARRHDIAHSYVDLSALLADDSVQAVYVSTTNELHCQQVQACAAAGKHVLCEKPLATSMDDALAMVEACRRHGVQLATNHHLRNSDSHRQMRQLVAAGALGKLNSARVFHAVELPQRLRGWRINRATAGGGVVLDITVHDIDSLRFILGRNPIDVVAMSHNAGMAEGAIEDGNMAVYRFEDEILAQVHVSFSVPFAGHGLEVHGDKGSLLATGVMAQGGEQRLVLRDASGERPIPLHASNYYETAVDAFHAAMRGEGSVAASGLDGLWSLAAALATVESASSCSRASISNSMLDKAV